MALPGPATIRPEGCYSGGMKRPPKPPPSKPVSPRDRAAAADKRTQLVKDQMAKESAALDARTAKLKALRLAKEAQDRETAISHPAPPKPKRKRIT